MNAINPDSSDGRANSIHAGFWSSLRETPLLDAIRGQWTRGLNLELAVAGFDLPATLQAFVLDVTKKTKLWRSEKVDVAKELAGHFRDGLDSGATVEHLIKRFGDPVQAAKMMRRARIRCRPAYWQVYHYSGRAVLILLCVVLLSYGVIAARFFTATATIARNYQQELNAVVEKVPEENRAWPFYREALMTPDFESKDFKDAWWRKTDFPPPADSPQWEELANYLKDREQAIALIHQGAERPELGYMYGDPANKEFLLKETGHETDRIGADGMLIELYYAAAQQLRSLARLLEIDIRYAAHQGDGDRVAKDLQSVFALADHARQDGFVIHDLISYATGTIGIVRMSDVMTDYPDLLTDRQLIDLAHQISTYAGGGMIRASFDRELWMFEDFLQRHFTDDGTGDGRLTPRGAEFLFQQYMEGSFHRRQAFEADYRSIFGPGLMALVGSRKANHDVLMDIFDRGINETTGPYYQWKDESQHNRLKEIQRSQYLRIKYFPALLLFPSIRQTTVAGERMTQNRDGVLTFIALHLFHRDEGNWPATLKDLVPRYLPEVPMDRITGEPLMYKVKGGRPIVYSVGMDRLDDGGRTSDNDRDRSNAMLLDYRNPNQATKPGEGLDWVLFPRHREPPRDED
ncbi:MAG: hypothetical protein WEB58_08470 [Planctomycetaceae bacterium]